MRPIVILSCLGLAGCGEGSISAAEEAAHSAVDGIADAARWMSEELSALDPAALAPDALRERAEQVRDDETARAVAASVERVLDAGGELLRRAAGELPSRAELRERIERLRAEHAGDEGVMETLDPVLQRLSRLLE